MRILRVAQKIHPEATGGGAYHVHAMSRDQAAMGHDVTVVTVSDDETRPDRERRDGYEVVRYPPRLSLLGNDIAPGVWRHLRRTEGVDVVHAHSHLYFSTNLAAINRVRGGPPLAITNHGLFSQNAPEWLFAGYLRSFGRLTFNAADVVFCYTPEDRRRLMDLGVRTDVAVVPNGIDTDRFEPTGPVSDRIVADGPVVLFVGRLVGGKRPQDAIDAIGQLPASLGAELFVIGEGPLEPELRARAKEAGLEERVTFLGHIPYGEMPEAYRAADALLLPSRAEGFPRTVLEAMASGVPVVASRLEQTASIVSEAGQTVEVGDVDGYARALSEVLSEGGDALGERGRSLVTDRFEWAETVEATTARLRELL